jgi:hypothetical protein
MSDRDDAIQSPCIGAASFCKTPKSVKQRLQRTEHAGAHIEGAISAASHDR